MASYFDLTPKNHLQSTLIISTLHNPSGIGVQALTYVTGGPKIWPSGGGSRNLLNRADQGVPNFPKQGYHRVGPMELSDLTLQMHGYFEMFFRQTYIGLKIT